MPVTAQRQGAWYARLRATLLARKKELLFYVAA